MLRGMTIFTTSRALDWGGLDVPMFGLAKDLHDTPLDPPAGFSLVADPQYLWFIASHRRPARLHPEAKPGVFQSGLWNHDVAELFLTNSSGRYLEFNLSPNGAWWTCEFTAPRVRAEAEDIAMPDIATFSEMAADGAWLAAMAIPLDILRARVDFGPDTRVNVTMILESPAQRFISACDLGNGAPDFHQPSKFRTASFVPIPE